MYLKRPSRIILSLFAVVAATLLSACQNDETGQNAAMDYQRGAFALATDELKAPATKTDENYVLNNVRLGSAALANYDLNTAESAFLKAHEVINSAHTNDAGRAVSAAVVSESTKIWKGEPFERAMVSYYLGVLYYMRHDYNNSRAAFENALFKLRDYSDTDKPDQYSEFESNFTIAYLMLGKCYEHLGDPAKAKNMFDTAVKLQPDFAPLAAALSQPSNVLLIVDLGFGPRKVTNVDHAFVGYGPTPAQAGPIPLPSVYVDGAFAPLMGPPLPAIDLLALAQDRKWQDIDTIRAVKSVVGKGLMGVGAYETLHGAGATGHRYNGDDVAVGLGMIAAGALLDASSQADLRQWEELPRTSFLIPLNLPPGTHDISVTFATGQQQTWHGLVAPPAGQEAAYYYRMLLYAPIDHTWPPNPAAPH